MCDTFVAFSSCTADGSIIFGKNSDREPNEAQALEYHPAQDYRGENSLRCTYLKIPQVAHTNAILISRPFWMWGAEMGANETGVVIGNEAVFTRMPMKKTGKLTGMDLLRLALERASSAESALEVIAGLLATYDQGGPCGYQDKKLFYHNSYIITDPHEAWVLETAGPFWAALKVMDFYSISNGLTIGEEFDLAHPELIDFAQKQGWIKKGRTFNFAQSYSDWFYTTFSASRSRCNRSSFLLKSWSGTINVPRAFSILRDHGAGPDYRPGSHFFMDRLCSHAANPLSRHAAQSTASLVAHIKPQVQTFWATGTSAPCTGIFKPIWFNKRVLPDIGPAPKGTFNPNSLWWHHEQLHRNILLDYQARAELFRRQRDDFEAFLINKTTAIPAEKTWTLSRWAFKKAMSLTDEWINRIRAQPLSVKANGLYRRYWSRQNRLANISVD